MARLQRVVGARHLDGDTGNRDLQVCEFQREVPELQPVGVDQHRREVLACGPARVVRRQAQRRRTVRQRCRIHLPQHSGHPPGWERPAVIGQLPPVAARQRDIEPPAAQRPSRVCDAAGHVGRRSAQGGIVRRTREGRHRPVGWRGIIDHPAAAVAHEDARAGLGRQPTRVGRRQPQHVAPVLEARHIQGAERRFRRHLPGATGDLPPGAFPLRRVLELPPT
jgi:hypothetical protein